MRQLGLDIGNKGLQATIVTGKRLSSAEDDDDGYLFFLDPSHLDEIKAFHSKLIRRLAEKRQVHSLIYGPHVRTRLIHTFEVIANSVLAAEMLGLNVSLCRAIAIIHDFGHGPYGHLFQKRTGIEHGLNGIIVAQKVERKGKGLNLSIETIRGVLNHSRDRTAIYVNEKMSNEEKLIVYIDKITYIFADINDCQRLGMFKDKNVPEAIFKFGNDPNAQRKRTEACIQALVKESFKKGTVSFLESEIAQEFKKIRAWMYREIYSQIDETREEENLEIVLGYLRNDGLALCENLHPYFAASFMTDREVDRFSEILRNRNPTKKELDELSLMEIIPSLNGKEIDHTKYDLW